MSGLVTNPKLLVTDPKLGWLRSDPNQLTFAIPTKPPFATASKLTFTFGMSSAEL